VLISVICYCVFTLLFYPCLFSCHFSYCCRYICYLSHEKRDTLSRGRQQRRRPVTSCCSWYSFLTVYKLLVFRTGSTAIIRQVCFGLVSGNMHQCQGIVRASHSKRCHQRMLLDPKCPHQRESIGTQV
jgi:hypothetical protein